MSDLTKAIIDWKVKDNARRGVAKAPEENELLGCILMVVGAGALFVLIGSFL